MFFFVKGKQYPNKGGESGVLMLKMITKLKVPTDPQVQSQLKLLKK